MKALRWLGVSGLLALAAILLIVSFLFIGPLLGFWWFVNFPTGSMAPTLNPRDKLIVSAIGLKFTAPKRGDLVTFSTDGIAELSGGFFFIKRIAGMPGEHIKIKDGVMFINGTKTTLSNAYGPLTNIFPANAVFTEIDRKIPAGHYFVLGDNSLNSNDSRYWGTLPRENIIGRVWWRYSPSTQAGPVK